MAAIFELAAILQKIARVRHIARWRHPRWQPNSLPVKQKRVHGVKLSGLISIWGGGGGHSPRRHVCLYLHIN